jgi:hypothetical protein
MTFLRAIPRPAVALAKEDSSGRGFNEGRCSMKITEDVRRYAAEQGMNEQEAVERSLEQEAKEFVEKGSEVCAGN